MPKQSTPAAPPEPIAAVRQFTIPKLSERAVGRLTYAVGVGASGAVYLAVTDNQGGGSFSREQVPLHKVQTVLATPLATGEGFATALLRRAFVSRSNCNGGFLAAVLRHEGLLKPGDPAHLHVCTGDWEVWADNQRHRLAKGSALPVEPAQPLPQMPKAEAHAAEDGTDGGDQAPDPKQEALPLAETPLPVEGVDPPAPSKKPAGRAREARHGRG